MTRFYNRSTEKDLRRQLRKEMPQAEVKLWSALNKKFRRQCSIGAYVVDFYCAEARLAIELDGDSHYVTEEKKQYDARRQGFIESFGIRVMRFTNDEVFSNVDGVLEVIARALTPPTPP